MSTFYLLDAKNGSLRDPQIVNSTTTESFVNYFEQPQSVNIVSWQRYFLVTEDNTINSITLTLPSEDPADPLTTELNGSFFFVDTTVLSNNPSPTPEDIDNQNYYDLDSLRKYSLTLTPTTSDNYKIYSFIVGFRSDVAGEFSDYIAIDDGTTASYLRIGTDVYNEDEPLTGNLENFGFEMPSAVQKAIYTSSVHEELNDNILLNRKKRELLMNYWNIVAGKGSYKSLIDSLKWFEYGDFVRINEYWQMKDADRNIFVGDDLETVLDDAIEKRLAIMKKTTYYGLYLLVNPNTTGIDGELNPKTDEIVLKWCMEDMYLKMTLLGNFYSTYFMPIHLALLHSTVERRVYAVGLQIMNASQISRRDYFEANCPMLMTLVGEDAGLYLEDTESYVYMDTIFGVHNGWDNDLDPEHQQPRIFVGVEPNARTMEYLPVPQDPSDNELSLSDFAENMFSGIGKNVQFHCHIPERWTNPNDVIWKQRIVIKRGTENSEEYFSYVTVHPTTLNNSTYYDFDFWLLFRNVGTYQIRVEFQTLDRKIYTAKSNVFEIKDNGNCELVPHLVEKLCVDWDTDFTDNLYNEVNFNNFVFRNTDQHTKVGNQYYSGIQYIVTQGTNVLETVGMNHFVGILWDKSSNLVFGDSFESSENTTVTIYTTDTVEDILNSLSSTFPYYWWDVRNPLKITTSYPISPDDDDTDHILIRGIRKPYTIDADDTDTDVFSKTYTVHYGEESATFTLTKPLSGDATITPTSSGNFTVDFVPSEASCYIEFYYDDDLIYKKTEYYNIAELLQYTDAQSTNPYKVHITDGTTDGPDRYVDEDRFFPVLHELVPIEEPCHIRKDQLVAIVPTFERSYNLNDFTQFNWQFTNESDGTHFENTPIDCASREPWVAKFEPAALTNGYWSATLNLLQNGDHIRTIKKDSLLRIV